MLLLRLQIIFRNKFKFHNNSRQKYCDQILNTLDYNQSIKQKLLHIQVDQMGIFHSKLSKQQVSQLARTNYKRYSTLMLDQWKQVQSLCFFKGCRHSNQIMIGFAQDIPIHIVQQIGKQIQTQILYNAPKEVSLGIQYNLKEETCSFCGKQHVKCLGGFHYWAAAIIIVKACSLGIGIYHLIRLKILERIWRYIKKQCQRLLDIVRNNGGNLPNQNNQLELIENNDLPIQNNNINMQQYFYLRTRLTNIRAQVDSMQQNLDQRFLNQQQQI